MTLTAPTTPSGYVEDSVYWSAALSDFGELVPDCMWPTSNFTFSQMRKDPQLAGVLKAYTLPIRRATWSVDPAGCRPEVVAMVADDLGLQIKGQDGEQTGARVHGVSWKEHLRASLLDLTYGHMGFELLAEIRDDKQAHLVGLLERMPFTIGNIRIAPDGSLLGIDQYSMAGQRTQPQIEAKNLAWYVREREGAAWQGQSLLRPAFAPWLLKREMQRVLATSNRRFGMGVPTLRALPGTVPTPAQETAAAQFAQSIRVGEHAGGSVPPGYVVELLGLTGSVPDTLGFINWLDQQMSRAMLTGFMDLGNTPNGSRALGDSFIDLFLLTLQTDADDRADTATRQVAARIVEWNYGPDEPVPAITVGDVGSSHAVTAEAISALVRFGALQPDPALDAFVRKEWNIPARVVPYVEPLPPDAPVQPGSSHSASAPAAPRVATPRRRRKVAPTNQPMLPFAAASGNLRRDLTPIEAASGADFDQAQQQWQDERAQLLAQWPEMTAGLIALLALLAGKAVSTGNLADLGTLVATKTVLAPIVAAVETAMNSLATTSGAAAVAEAASQGVAITAGELDVDRLHEAADAVVNVIASGYANGAARTAMLHAGPDVAATVVEDAVTTSLEAMSAAGDTGWVATNLSSILSLAQHEGRMTAFDTAVETPHLYASEVLDSGTCEPCIEIDGTEFADWVAAYDAYPTGRYKYCLGADRCRGMVIATWGSAPAPRGPGLPKPAEPAKPPAETPAPVEPPPAPAEPEAPAGPALADHVASGVESSQQLGGGMSAKTELVTFADGSKAVSKQVLNDWQRDPVESQDAEELASLYAAAVGVPAPEVYRTGPDSLYMAYVEDGVTGMERFAYDISGDPNAQALADSVAGRQMGLFDLAVGNTDRNGGNWIVDSDDVITGLDHGTTFQQWAGNEDELAQMVRGPGNIFAHRLDASGNYSTADVEHMREALAQVEAEFARLNRDDWYAETLARLEALEAAAAGSGSLF